MQIIMHVIYITFDVFHKLKLNQYLNVSKIDNYKLQEIILKKDNQISKVDLFILAFFSSFIIILITLYLKLEGYINELVEGQSQVLTKRFWDH